MHKFKTAVQEKFQNIKEKKARKAMRKKLRKIKKRIFNRKTLTKIFMILMSLALVGSYVLPYILK